MLTYSPGHRQDACPHPGRGAAAPGRHRRYRREHAQALLAAARVAKPGTLLTVDGTAYRRIANGTVKSRRLLVQAVDHAVDQAGPDGTQFDTIKEEREAF